MSSNDVPRAERGTSFAKKDVGRASLVKFMLVIQGPGGKVTEIKPWGGKPVEVLDWLRNISALTARDVRYELASFVEVKEDSLITLDGELVETKRIPLAFFSSDNTGDMYDTAAYLVPESILKRPGNRVRLTLLGCCSIIGVSEVKDDKEDLLLS